jgi:hypothetical protein
MPVIVVDTNPSMSKFELSVQGTKFTTTKRTLIDFFDVHPELFNTSSYDVSSDVSPDLFRVFLTSLEAQKPIAVTEDNAQSLVPLAREFCQATLLEECWGCISRSHPSHLFDQLLALTERITKIESELTALRSSRDTSLNERLESLEKNVLTSSQERLESLEKSVLRWSEDTSLNDRLGSLEKVISSCSRDTSLSDRLESLETSVLRASTDSSVNERLQSLEKSVLRSSRDTSVSERLESLERSLSHPSVDGSVGERVESLEVRIESVETLSRELRGGLEELKALSRTAVEGMGTYRDFPFKAGHTDAFGGIFGYLRQKCQGNVHTKGIVIIKSSSVDSDSPLYLPKNVVDGRFDTVFGTKHLRDSWISFKFARMTVILEHYTLRTFHDTDTWTARYLLSWILEGSEDGMLWRALDQQQGCQTLNGPDRVGVFAVPTRAECRYLRIRMTGPAAPGNVLFLELAQVEFFGKLISTS